MEQPQISSSIPETERYALRRREDFWKNLRSKYLYVSPSSEAKNMKGSYPYEFPSTVSPLLYSPVFSKFLEDLDNTEIIVEDREAALIFAEASKQDDEDKKVNPLVTEALKKALHMDETKIGRLQLPSRFSGSGKKRETDITIHFGDYIAANVELKKQNGQGDALRQNIAYFLSHYSNTYKSLPNDVLPAFLITQFGRILSVHGIIISLDSVQITELTHMEMSGPLSRDFDQQVRLFAALRNGCKYLEEHYKKLDRVGSFQNLFPFKKEFASSKSKFLFIEKLERLVFEAIITESEEKQLVNKHVIIKFTRKYSAEAHNFFAQLGISPLLYSCEKMTPEKSAYYMVVVEKIEGDPLFEFKETDKIDFKDIKLAVAKAHKAGFVHGDLRTTNILVNKEGIPKVIDFDWAGKIGEAKYPSTMNINAKPRQWSGDAIPLGPILPEHDNELLEKLSSEESIPIGPLTLDEK